MGMKVWIDQDLCTGDGLCEEIVPAIFFGHSDGLFYVREAGTDVPTEPTHQMYQTVDVPEDLAESTIEAAEECPCSNKSFLIFSASSSLLLAKVVLGISST